MNSQSAEVQRIINNKAILGITEYHKQRKEGIVMIQAQIAPQKD